MFLCLFSLLQLLVCREVGANCFLELASVFVWHVATVFEISIATSSAARGFASRAFLLDLESNLQKLLFFSIQTRKLQSQSESLFVMRMVL